MTVDDPLGPTGAVSDLTDVLATIEKNIDALLGGGTGGGNRAARRARRGSKPGSGKHPLGATKPLRSESAARRRKRKRAQ